MKLAFWRGYSKRALETLVPDAESGEESDFLRFLLLDFDPVAAVTIGFDTVDCRGELTRLARALNRAGGGDKLRTRRMRLRMPIPPALPLTPEGDVSPRSGKRNFVGIRQYFESICRYSIGIQIRIERHIDQHEHSTRPIILNHLD